MTSYFSEFHIFPIFLVIFGILLITAVYALDYYRKKNRHIETAETKETETDEPQKPAGNNTHPMDTLEPADNAKRSRQGLTIQTLERKPFALFPLLRVLLIPLSLVVAAALLLILLPQSTTDSIVRELQFRKWGGAREKVAFLYLGHRIQKNEFQIRGVLRNITTESIDQLDAAIRLYGKNRNLLETAIVRMDKETIDPNDIARFELVYPDYESEFSSYSVEFKLRRGEVISYRDMRETLTQSGRESAVEDEQQ